MLKGFKDFLMRGNVVDLAVAVVIGAAFGTGAFITALVAFVIVAAAVYFLVVMPLNKLAERRARGLEPKTEAPSEEVQLLTEIRDSLRIRV